MHPNVCNWISSETISCKKGKWLFLLPKGLCSLCCMWTSFKFTSIRIPGGCSGKWWERTQRYQKGSRRSTNPSALGGAVGQWYIAEKSTNWSQTSVCFCIPGHVEGLAPGMLIMKSKLTALWSLWHATIPLQQPYINVLKFICSSTESLEVSTVLNTRRFPPLLKGKGTRHWWQVSYILSWWKTSLLIFDRATSVYHRWRSAALL